MIAAIYHQLAVKHLVRYPVASVKDLGITLDSYLNFNDTATTEIYTILFVGSVRCV